MIDKKDPTAVPENLQRKKETKKATRLTRNDKQVLRRARVLRPTRSKAKAEPSKKQTEE
jgi:hypothetical protein